jgi:hypothetical protein
VRLETTKRLAVLGAALLAAVLLLTAVAGCRRVSSGDRIDPLALERELERVVGLQLVTQHFYGRTVEVACLGDGDDLHYKCHVDAKNPTLRTQSWDVLVACEPPSGRSTQRCFTADGDALQ